MADDHAELFSPTLARVRVTNNNEFLIEDRCDNVSYAFPTGKKVDIPLDAALHIFGFHAEAKEEDVFKHVCKRMGWNTVLHVASGNDKKYFDNIEIRPVFYKLTEVESGLEFKRRRGRPPLPKAEIIDQSDNG